MRKAFLSCLAILGMIALGCDEIEQPEEGKENGTEQNQGNENGNGNENSDVYNVQEQKQKLEALGEELIGYAGLDNWSDTYNSFLKFAITLSDERNDMSAFEEELIDAVEYDRDDLGENDDYENFGGWQCMYVGAKEIEHHAYETIIPSKVAGRFELDKNKKAWQYQPSSTFDVIANVDGSMMKASASFQQRSDKLLISEHGTELSYTWNAYTTGPAVYREKVMDEDGYGYYYRDITRENGNGETEYHLYNPVTGQDLGWWTESDYNEYYNHNLTVNVPAGRRVVTRNYGTYAYLPEKVNVTFTDGNTKRADIALDLKYNNAAPGVVNLANDSFDLGMDFTVGSYNLKSTKLDWMSGSANAGYVLSCGGKPVITAEVKESGASILLTKDGSSYHEDANEYQPWTYEYKSWGTDYQMDKLPVAAEVNIDILGKLSIKGNCNVTKIYELSGQIDENTRQNEAAFKSVVANMEKEFSLDVAFDGSTAASASVGLEALLYEGSTMWNVVPVIRFADGTSYALFEDFFNEDDFASLINTASAYIESVETFLQNSIKQNVTASVTTMDAEVRDYDDYFAAWLRGTFMQNTSLFSGNYGFLISETAKTLEQLKESGEYLSAWSDGRNEDGSRSFSRDIQGKPGATYYYVARYDVAGERYYGEVKSFTMPKRIIADGDFSDWNALGSNEVYTATNSSDTPHTALQVLKVNATNRHVSIYIMIDESQVNLDYGVPFHIYFNADGSTKTGGFSDSFTDACVDFMLESSLFRCNYGERHWIGNWVYQWIGETNSSGWNWDGYSGLDYIFGGNGNEFEFVINRDNMPFALSETFGIGIDVLNSSWDTIGRLPNASATTTNPNGLANMLYVTTVKQ